MILVTKEGKLITLDFDKKTKVTVLTSIVYTEKGEKKTLSSNEFLPAKGGD